MDSTSHPDPCDRDEIVEQLIRETSRANLATRALRDWQAHVGENGATASYVMALLARCDRAESNVARLIAERAKAA